MENLVFRPKGFEKDVKILDNIEVFNKNYLVLQYVDMDPNDPQLFFMRYNEKKYGSDRAQIISSKSEYNTVLYEFANYIKELLNKNGLGVEENVK